LEAGVEGLWELQQKQRQQRTPVEVAKLIPALALTLVADGQVGHTLALMLAVDIPVDPEPVVDMMFDLALAEPVEDNRTDQELLVDNPVDLALAEPVEDNRTDQELFVDNPVDLAIALALMAVENSLVDLVIVLAHALALAEAVEDNRVGPALALVLALMLVVDMLDIRMIAEEDSIDQKAVVGTSVDLALALALAQALAEAVEDNLVDQKLADWELVDQMLADRELVDQMLADWELVALRLSDQEPVEDIRTDYVPADTKSVGSALAPILYDNQANI
jgi:hypothetical protein